MFCTDHGISFSIEKQSKFTKRSLYKGRSDNVTIKYDGVPLRSRLFLISKIVYFNLAAPCNIRACVVATFLVSLPI